jgi:hypothetical protein
MHVVHVISGSQDEKINEYKHTHTTTSFIEITLLSQIKLLCHRQVMVQNRNNPHLLYIVITMCKPPYRPVHCSHVVLAHKNF